VLRRVDGRYLWIRRGLDNTFGGYFCPVSGRVEEGESHPQTAVREAREEVGIEIRALREVHAERSASGHYMLYWWLCEHVDGQPRVADPTEVADVVWVSTTEAKALHPHFEVDIELMLRLDLGEI